MTAKPAHDAWIQTYSGLAFDLLVPDPDKVVSDDIAAALGKQCRFGGHITRHYSVAQHSVGVAHLLSNLGYGPEVVLQGLLHDATEAYVVDVPRPLKVLLAEYKPIEDRVWLAVAGHFGVPARLDPAVKWCDEQMLLHEAHALLPGGPQAWGSVDPQSEAPAIMHLVLTPEEAQAVFTGELEMLRQKIAALT